MTTATIGRSAEISDCGKYRWWLRRTWSGGTKGIVCFVMLNPSKADGSIDDPTVKKCMAFAMAWGYSGMVIVNLYAYRATDPGELKTAESPVGGKRNDIEIRAAAISSDFAIAAWGTKALVCRVWEVEEILKGVPIHCLKKTKAGCPQHPLYIKGDTVPQPFWNCA